MSEASKPKGRGPQGPAQGPRSTVTAPSRPAKPAAPSARSPEGRPYAPARDGQGPAAMRQSPRGGPERAHEGAGFRGGPRTPRHGPAHGPGSGYSRSGSETRLGPGGIKGRKALTNIGGPSRFSGDRSLRPLLERAAIPPAHFDERYLTHGFHAWPARLHPFSAKALIEKAPPGAIGDPFMGGGTVPLEAMLAKRVGVGNDLNPLGLEVAWTRTRLTTPEQRRAIEAMGKKVVRESQKLREEARLPLLFREKLAYAFDPQALHEVWSLSTVLQTFSERYPDDLAVRVVRAAFSSILVKMSRLVSDTVQKLDRNAQGISPKGKVEQWLKRRLVEVVAQLEGLARHLPEGAPEPLLRIGDAREAFEAAPEMAAVISSPPYPGIYDYVEHHKVRLLALGLPLDSMVVKEIGSRRESERLGRDAGLSRYVESMTQVIKAWGPKLRDDGFMCLVVGDGQVNHQVLPVVPLIEEAAQDSGLKVKAVLSQPRPVFDHKASHQEKAEHFVWLAR